MLVLVCKLNVEIPVCQLWYCSVILNISADFNFSHPLALFAVWQAIQGIFCCCFSLTPDLRRTNCSWKVYHLLSPSLNLRNSLLWYTKYFCHNIFIWLSQSCTHCLGLFCICLFCGNLCVCAFLAGPPQCSGPAIVMVRIVRRTPISLGLSEIDIWLLGNFDRNFGF